MIISHKFERRLVSIVIASVVAVLSFASVAQATNRISVLPGFNGPVNAISEPDSNGTRYLGGNFTLFQPWDTGGGALVGASSGAVNPTFPKVNGRIYATAADGSGGFYIGGSFDCIGPNISRSCNGVDDVTLNNAAHINADGSVDLDWNPNLDGNVLAIGVLGSTVYLGGEFEEVGGDADHNYAAAVTTAGTLTDWNPDPNDYVHAIGVLGSTVYLGGEFTNVGGNPNLDYAAAVVAVGTAGAGDLTSWNPNLGGGNVRAIGVLGSTVYLGGEFEEVGGDADHNYAAAVTTAGTLVPSWNPDPNDAVYAIGVLGSTVYLGGEFTNVGGNPNLDYAAAVTIAGTLVPSWNPDPDDAVYAIGVLGSTVYLGGQFNTVGGITRNYAAAVNTNGILTTWNPDMNNAVNAIGVLGSIVYLGGGFTTVGGITRNYAAAVTTAGTLDPDWNPNLNHYVMAIGVLESTVYLGGYFTCIGPTIGEDCDGDLDSVRNNAAAVTTAGTLTDWDPNLNSYVWAIGVLESTVYLGGQFTCIGPTIGYACDGDLDSVRYRAAAVTTAGTLTAWNPNLDFSVYAIGVLESTVYLGGEFGSANGGIPRSHAAAVNNTNGAVVDSWDPNLSSPVYAIGVSESIVYLGGGFTTAGGETHNHAAAITTAGTLTDWDPNLNGGVYAIGVSESIVYLGGQFTTVGGQARARSAAVGTNGALLGEWPALLLLSVTKSGSGSGTVTSLPTGIDCGADCSESLVGETSMTLTATPATGSTFTGWSGAGCSGTSTCTLTMSAARTVNAEFAVVPPGQETSPPSQASNAVTPVNTFTMKPLQSSASSAQFITTQLNLPGPGKVVQVGTTAKKAGTMIVCRARKTVAKAGKVTIICRLTAKALAARKKHALKVRLVTTFTPTGGTAFSISRTLVLKKTWYRPVPVTG